jgi:hypothetical protein
MKNQFWVVLNKKGKVVSISQDKATAQEEALNKNGHRWTYQTFKKDWGYLLLDGYKVLKSEIKPIKSKLK